MGRILDTNHLELYAAEQDAAKVWTKREARYVGESRGSIWYLRGKLSQIQFKDEPMVD